MGWKTALEWGVKLLGPGVVSGILNRGSSKTADRAQQVQMDISRALMQMQQQQFGVDLPFRKALFNRINQRQQRQRPRIMPGRAPVSNPYRNVRRVNPFQIGAPAPGANQSGGKYQIPLSMLLQGRMPQTSNALKNNAQQFAGIAPPKARPQPSSNPPN